MTFAVADTLFAEPGGAWRHFGDPVTTFPRNPGVVVDGVRLTAIDRTSAPYLDGYNKIISGSGGTATALPNLRLSQRFAASGYVGLDQGTRILGGTEVPSGVSADAYYVACRDDGVACAVQAYLSVIEGSASRRAVAISILEGYADVETFGPGAFLANTAYKPLINALGMEGMVQALSVLGDFPGRADIVSSFATNWWPSLWHPFGGNWLSSFANARLGIAVAAGDVDLWDQSVDYYDTVIKANVWLTSDGPYVGALPPHPVSGASSSPLNYPQHWWNAVGTDRLATNLVNGQNCEFTRDDSHLMMGNNGLMLGALTIEHQGYSGLDLYGDRLIATFEHAAASILAKLDSAQTPSGGTAWRAGWLPALATFGASEVPNVAELVSRSTDISLPFTGNNFIMQGLLWPVGT